MLTAEHLIDFLIRYIVIAKLRRGIDVDLDDALLVAHHHHISADSIQASARAALAASPQDTALFLFQKTIDLFCKSLTSSAHQRM